MSRDYKEGWDRDRGHGDPARDRPSERMERGRGERRMG